MPKSKRPLALLFCLIHITQENCLVIENSMNGVIIHHNLYSEGMEENG